MEINNSLIDSLLYGEEGVDLDFKRDQYKFSKATDDEKGELLKDILAFANSWRRSDAFILIGIQEVKGSRCKVHGISNKLDDAHIQQFINGKTNVPVTFSYRNMDFESKSIGIIHIPIQARPIYLKKDFGKLKKDTVYIKRGSSTEIAKLDEVAKMGNSLNEIEQGNPKLELFYADLSERILLPDTKSISTLILITPNRKDIPDYEEVSSKQFPWASFSINQVNYSYYKELAKFTKQNRFYSPINFAIKNIGPSVARDVRIEMKISSQNNIIKAIDRSDILSLPKSSYNSLHDNLYQQIEPFYSKQYLNVSMISKNWLIEAGVDKVQPKSTTWLENSLYIGAKESLEFSIETTIYSDDLPEPSKKVLIVQNDADTKKVKLEEIEELEQERFRKSDEYKEFKRRHLEKLKELKPDTAP